MGQNPWDPGRTAGGSSTGAGVAASLGMGRIHVGTDSGGSVRNPACHCGVVGFTPGLGLLSHEGGTNRAPSLNAVGLLAGNVADVATAFRALAPQGGSPSVRRRLVVPRRLTEQSCDDETLVLFEQALARARDAGFECIDAEIDAWDAGQRGAGTISTYESALSLAATDLSRVSRSTRGRIAKAEALTSADISAAAAAAAALRRAVDATLAACAADAIATPTWPFAAPLIEADEVEVQGRKVPLDVYRHIFVRPANAITGCAISLPMGLYPTARVPAGLHLLAMGGAEATLLSVAGAIEAVLPPIGKPPPLR
jgi:Asp-tRNA(Asn)/Glu-tRNA(Gln) amidotransferase A subunit family amidase